MFQGMGGMAAYKAAIVAALGRLVADRKHDAFWKHDWMKPRRLAWKRKRSSGLYR